MSQPATRPWWADVQHLRPAEDGGQDDRAPRGGRFERRPTGEHAATSRVAGRAAHAAPAPRRRERREPEVWLDEVTTRATPGEEPAGATPPPPPASNASKGERRPERRTIEIRGQVDRVHGVAPVGSPGPQRIRGRRADERVGPRPDRVAMWAVVLGLLLILVAAISSSGAEAAALLPIAI